MEHLTNSCSVSNTLWQKHQQLFEISDRDTSSITTTVEKWRRKPYRNVILNQDWNLSIEFLLWNIWKARNQLIFKEDEQNKKEIWSQITQNIRETIIIEKWNEED